MRGNLDGVRVLDLTSEAGHFAGKLLGDLGADVVKVEPPAGDAARHRGPFWGHADDRERSLAWLAYNTSKRGITLDVTKPRGRDLFLALAARADVVIESEAPGALARAGLGWTELRAANPRLVLCSLTPWGQTGPYAGWRGSDLTAVAMSGNLHCTGDPDRAPVRCSMPVAHYHASIEAALAVTFALVAREESGRGQHLDVAMQAAMVMPNMATASMAKMNGNRGARAGAFFRQGRSVQREIWPCKDGWVSFALRGGPARVPGLIAMVKLMDEHGMASEKLKAVDWKAYNHPGGGRRAVGRVRRLLPHEDDDGALPGGGGAQSDARPRQHRPRDRRVRAAGVPGVLRRRRASGARAPTHARRVREDHGRRRRGRRHPPSGAAARRAHGGGAGRDRRHGSDADRAPTREGVLMEVFRGTMILEMGAGAAGPVATRYFADAGATVVRIESRARPDFLRTLKLTPNTPGGLDAAEHFAVLNVNKLSVALNLSMPGGVAVAKRLALRADAIAENFAPGAMKKWGLDYATLVRERPDLVMISTCLNGATGPHRFYPGFGGQGSALSGFNHLTGWSDRAPLGPYGTITDSLSPRFSALLLASALLHRRRTGEGQHIDLSQVEGGIACLGETLLTFAANGETVGRIGNRDRHAAPHGVFRCRDADDGRERWIAVAVHDDVDWRALVDAMGRPAWATDASLAAASGRLARVGEVECHLDGWTRTQDARALAERLQQAGLDAAPVLDLGDLHDDPQLVHRRHFRWVDHPVLGHHPAEMNAIIFSDTPTDIRTPAPKLGEHTTQVLRDLLRMSAEEYTQLEQMGVLS
jgi:crotonobetainyl-CoA:carnitine CoA-transferase CaiB-like acyl-CoA transferase